MKSQYHGLLKSLWGAVLFIALLAGVTAFAGGTPTQYKVELENHIRDRVAQIVEKVEATSIIQVRVNLKTVSSDLPGVGMGAVVVPTEEDGKLNSTSVSNIEIRILTPSGQIPTWLIKEVEQAVKLNDVKVKIGYEKIGGEIQAPPNETLKLMQKVDSEFLEQFVKKDAFEVIKTVTEYIGSIKKAAWGMVMALLGSVIFLAAMLMLVSSRFEQSLARVIESKLLPALQQMRGGGGEQRARVETETEERKPFEIQLPSAPGQRELADIPVAIVANLLIDCYWTQSDGYAHWLWEQATQTQREALLSLGKLDRKYFSYIRQFDAVNLKYHNDARYFMLGDDFSTLDQNDLADWVRKNPTASSRITPLRWDVLPIGLPDRIKFSQTALAAVDDSKPVVIEKKSARRTLAMKLEVKSLSFDDEIFVFNNASAIPLETRKSLKTLAWFALAPLEYRQSILQDLDAREIAEALEGPEEILAAIRESVTGKKLESVLHYAKEITGDRTSDTYSFLVDAGLRAPVSQPPALKVA